MLGLFKKKPLGIEGLKEQAAAQEAKMDLCRLAETYYQLGKAYQEQGDLERARLYLERSCTLYSNFDRVYESSQKFMDDCDERIGDLEEQPLLYNELREQVEEKAEELSNAQKYYWGLLSLARFQVVLQKLADCENSRILGEIGPVLNVLYRTIVQREQQEDLEYSLDYITRFYDFCDSEGFVNRKNQVKLADGTDLQLFDLNGNSTVTSMHLFVDKFISVVQYGFETVEENEEAETDFIPCTILADYYLRTREGELREIPQVKAEVERIWSDYDFVKADPDAQEVIHRLEQYRRMDVLK